MTYAAIHGGGRAVWNFLGFSPKVTISLSCYNLSSWLKPLLMRSVAIIHAINGMVSH